jgi:hypothetical protein
MSFSISLALESNSISNPASKSILDSVSKSILDSVSNSISNSASNSISNSPESKSILSSKWIYISRSVSISESRL